MIERITQLLDTHETILFAGVGNVLRKDDGAGIYICEHINQTSRIQSLVVGQSIENYIGKIRQLGPDLLVIVDCIDCNKSPGEAFIIPLDELLDYTSNTHNISIKTLAQFFEMPVEVLGIQPQDVGYGEGMSQATRRTADKVIGMINEK